MALIDGQIQVRDLVMGPGTPFEVPGFNPFNRSARADQSGKRAWAHGGWSGVEWAEEVVVPLNIVPVASDAAAWWELFQQLAEVFRPIGETVADVELRWTLGGREYVMFGRPRMVEPDVESIGFGWSFTQAAFVALDPRIYDGAETSITGIGLPVFSGGLTLPFTLPFAIDAVAADGFAEMTNEGRAETGLDIRIDGPVEKPIVTLIRNDGTLQRLNIDITLASGQWLDIDTANRIVLLNGAQSRRGQVSGQWPILPKGTHELRWRSPKFNDVAEMSVSFRSAWW